MRNALGKRLRKTKATLAPAPTTPVPAPPLGDNAAPEAVIAVMP